MQKEQNGTNRLIHATSPYLLQHANNPVDWYEWGEEALDKAQREDKPILVSIGYSSCHWCHVMERESFENDSIASIMNENFVCIKVDREERPDIDHIYMDAVQAMGLNGGWPLNVFLTPDQKPFYGGTYFPPKNWSQLLQQIAQTYEEKNREISSSADELTRHLNASDVKRFSRYDAPENLSLEGFTKMYQSFHSRFDNKWGGLDRSPKFVMPTQWQLLLRYYAKTKSKEALDMVNFTLAKMASGGLYDQVGGGFARYSVDEKWFAPHFEKMLYDNAQLLTLYAEAYSIEPRADFKIVIEETIEWLRREMTHSDGGFYSALDADSEGVEGKYYVWKKDEFDQVVNNSPSWLAEYYSVADSGNWEHGTNILFIEQSKDEILDAYGISDEQFYQDLQVAKLKLRNARDKRIRPGLDDKILTGWNAMMIKGLCDSYKALGTKRHLDLALQNIDFLEKHLIDDVVYRSYRGKRSSTEGFMEDYASLINAYIALYQVTFDETWLSKADRWTSYVQENFYDAEEGYYHFSSDQSANLIARKKEIFDNVIPSSNSIMAANLFHMGILLDNEAYISQSRKMVSAFSQFAENEPAYMSNWGILYSEMLSPTSEIVIVSPKLDEVALQLQKSFLPFSVLMGTKSSSELPLVRDKINVAGKEATIYVCYNKTCKMPVHTIEDALDQLAQTKN